MIPNRMSQRLKGICFGDRVSQIAYEIVQRLTTVVTLAQHQFHVNSCISMTQWQLHDFVVTPPIFIILKGDGQHLQS